MHRFSRTEALIGKEALDKLSKSKVLVLGIGGVGSYVAEGLARSGVGHLTLVDSAVINITNLNRQIHATQTTVGKYKVDIMKERIININPDMTVDVYKTFFLPGGEDSFFDASLDYVVDAVDTVSAKLEIVVRSKREKIPVISSMGAGNKLLPSEFKVGDIYETSVDPLARVMRKELRKRGIKSLKVVYSTEKPSIPIETPETIMQDSSDAPPASISFVPSTAGLIIAGEVVKDIIAPFIK